MSAYKNLYRILVHPIRAMFRIKVYGTENIPENGGYLICSNHTSLWDVFVIAVSLERQVMYMAKKELFSVPLLGKIISALGAYPVNRGAADISAIKKTVSLLKDENIVGVFPQGTRHPGENPRDTEVRHGVGLISYRAECGAIPVYIKTKNNQVRPFRRAELFIGKPIEYQSFGFKDGGMKEYTDAAEMIFDRICTIGEASQGESSEAKEDQIK